MAHVKEKMGTVNFNLWLIILGIEIALSLSTEMTQSCTMTGGKTVISRQYVHKHCKAQTISGSCNRNSQSTFVSFRDPPISSMEIYQQLKHTQGSVYCLHMNCYWVYYWHGLLIPGVTHFWRENMLKQSDYLAQ